MSAPVLLLGHAADRTGPPVYLLHLLRWVRAHRPEAEVEVALLSGGELVDDLRELAPVTVFGALSGIVPSEVREGIVDGDLDEAEWWRGARARALADMMSPFGSSRVVYVNCAPSIELAQALPPADRVLLSHVHELEIGLVHRLPPDARAAFLHQPTRVFSVADAVTDHLVRSHGVDPATIERHPEMVAAEAIATELGDLDRAEARRARGIDPGHHVVGACGTIEFRKGTDLFLRVAWELHRASGGRPLTCIWVGGDDAGLERARRRAEHLGLGDVVRFVGPQPDPAAWFRMMDVFVMPSREDPFPLVCIEAAAVGTPVVAFDTGGIQELLRQGCGEVVAYPDVVALAGAVGALLDDEGRRREMAEAGRELAVAQHDVSVVAPRAWAAIERWV